MTIRIGALISGTGSNLSAVMAACRSGKIDGRVVFAGADNPGAAGLEKARAAEIPAFVVDYRDMIRQYRQSPESFSAPDDFDAESVYRKTALFEGRPLDEVMRAFLTIRAAAEARLLKEMTAYPCDLLILAGFMRNLTPYFIDRFNTDPARPRIMNIHPALLPAFPGVDGYGDTFRYGCKVGGCTVHFIDYGEDTGPIIGQRSFEILPEDTIDTVRQKGLSLEWELYPYCIQLFAENRLRLKKLAHEQEGIKTERTIVVVQ
ncbi:MAG: phosphoribosylglycinamide formyltransferase [Thermodesulfobacteriota bacterium]